MFSLSNVHFNTTLTHHGALTMIPRVREPKLFNRTPNPLASQAKQLEFKNKGLSKLTNVNYFIPTPIYSKFKF